MILSLKFSRTAYSDQIFIEEAIRTLRKNKKKITKILFFEDDLRLREIDFLSILCRMFAVVSRLMCSLYL